MSKFNADDYVNLVNHSASPADVDAAFDKVQKLPEGHRKTVVDAVETLFVNYWQQMAGSPVEIAQAKGIVAMMEKAMALPQGALIVAAMEAESPAKREGQLMSQIALNIHKIKGEAAHPIVKTYVAEAAKLSDEEYNSSMGHVRLLVTLCEKMGEIVEKKPAPPNPFRRNAPPGPA
jgi:hypothetical protein